MLKSTPRTLSAISFAYFSNHLSLERNCRFASEFFRAPNNAAVVLKLFLNVLLNPSVWGTNPVLFPMGLCTRSGIQGPMLFEWPLALSLPLSLTFEIVR